MNPARAPAYSDDAVTVHLGDCLDILPQLPPCSVDAIVTDPPYGLDFMGKHWDTGAVAFNPDTWRHCLRVLKPGGHMLAFGGTRTWHRLACAIEDAGLEIRENLAWLYGSGFPKSLDVSKAIDRAAGAQREIIGKSARHVSGKPEQRTEGLTGSSTFAESIGMGQFLTAPATAAAKQWAGWGTALKPAFEPIILARKPLAGTVAANVLLHGVGGLNIDACRIATDDTLSIGTGRMGYHGADGSNPGVQHGAGRWPANVILDPHAAALLDQQSGKLHAPGTNGGNKNSAVYGIDVTAQQHASYSDSGGASRFFYTPKAPTDERPTHNGTTHPTVKPVELMRWLVRLITPPHGLVLDPFAGTGSAAEACIHEHMRCILIEREPDYLPLITARLRKPMQVGFDFNEATT